MSGAADTVPRVEDSSDRHGEKPQNVRDFEDALLITIMLFTFITWIFVLLRMLAL